MIDDSGVAALLESDQSVHGERMVAVIKLKSRCSRQSRMIHYICKSSMISRAVCQINRYATVRAVATLDPDGVLIVI